MAGPYNLNVEILGLRVKNFGPAKRSRENAWKEGISFSVLILIGFDCRSDYRCFV